MDIPVYNRNAAREGTLGQFASQCRGLGTPRAVLDYFNDPENPPSTEPIDRAQQQIIANHEIVQRGGVARAAEPSIQPGGPTFGL